FVCDPANNVIHRDVLEPKGATFVAKRGDADCEFFASTDTCCRPVCLTLGPDGAMYVLDFYREVIETPLSLPQDMKETLPLKSQGKGRIWRIVPQGKAQLVTPNLAKAKAEELVQLLDHPNYWWRITAQRLLIERNATEVATPLRNLAMKSQEPFGRVHALWAMQGVKRLNPELPEFMCKDPNAHVRRHALQTAEALLPNLQEALGGLSNDPVFEVRFQ